MNLKIVALQIKLDLLDNLGIIWVEKKHNPISYQKNSCEIKNGYYPIFPLFVPKGVLWGTRKNQRDRNIL
jgi:hypothetical protein